MSDAVSSLEARRIRSHSVSSSLRQERIAKLALQWTVLTLALISVIFPLYWMLLTAFDPPTLSYSTKISLVPKQLTFAAFAQLIREYPFLLWMWNSAVVAILSTLLAVVVGTMAAYSLVRFKTGGENLAVWIISQRMMPPVAIVFPVFLLYVFFGWVDTFFGLILLYTAFNLPYVIWMMRGYIEDIPLELEESALVDGCSRWEVLWKVVMPMARSGLFATAVFTFVFAWNEFLFALVLTRSEVTTFPVQVTHYLGGQSNFYSKIAAMSVLGTLPIFVAVAMLQRFLVRGISLGAVKG